jgi:hypothetical protein
VLRGQEDEARAAKPLVAEADGNRTRLSRVAAHTGFEDRGDHQAADTSAGSLLPRSGRLTWGFTLCGPC